MKFQRQARLLIMMGMTGGFFVVEIVVGYLSGSLALVADSFHMLSDIIALVVAFLAIRAAKKKGPTKSNSYGWQRAEVLGALVNGVFLIALCFTIFIEAIQKFFETTTIESPKLVLIVGGIGLGINLAAMLLFSGGHGHSHGGSHGASKESHGESHGHSHGEGGHGHSHGENRGHSHGGNSHTKSPKSEEEDLDKSSGPIPSRGQTPWSSSENITESQNSKHPVLYSYEMEETSHQVQGDPEEKQTIELQEGKIYIARKKVLSEKEGYLSFEKGDKILVLRNVKKNVYEGEVDGQSGKFSAKNVRVPVGEKDEPTPNENPAEKVEEEQHLIKEDESPQKQGKGGLSSNMKAAFLHVLGDALGSVGVIFVSLMIWLTDFSWRFYLDPIVSFFITGMILMGTIPVVRQTSLIMLQGAPNLDFEELKEKVKRIPGVLGVHELHVWHLDDSKLVASAHVLISDVKRSVNIVAEVKKVLHQFDIHASTIQTEFKSNEPSDSLCAENCQSGCKEEGCCPGESINSLPAFGASPVLGDLLSQDSAFKA